MIELLLDRSDKGEGKMVMAAQVRSNSTGGIEIENYSSEPVRLNAVQKR